jgi:hypothetical protein
VKRQAYVCATSDRDPTTCLNTQREHFGARRQRGEGSSPSDRQTIHSLHSADNLTCPALNFSNRMSSRPIRASQTSMTEANFAPSYKRKPGSDVSTNIERHSEQCATVPNYNDYSKIVPTNVEGHLENCAKLRSQNDNSKIIGNDVEQHLTNCAILRSDNDKIKIVFTKLTNIVTRKIHTQFTFKMKDFASNKCFFNFINKQKASADAPKPTKNDTIQLETNVIDIEKATIHFKHLSNISKLQNLICIMNHARCM